MIFIYLIYLGAPQDLGGVSAAPPVLYCMYYYVVLSMYNVQCIQLHPNCPFFDHVKVAETEINDEAAKNALGSLGGSRTTPGVPRSQTRVVKCELPRIPSK